MMRTFFVQKNNLNQKLLKSCEGPRTIEIEPESRYVTCWKSPDPGWSGTFTYCGFALLMAKVLDYVEPSGFSTIVQAYERAMMDGRFVYGLSAADKLQSQFRGGMARWSSLFRQRYEQPFSSLH